MGRTEKPTDRLEASRGHRHWAKEIGPNQPLFRVDHGVRPKNNLTEPALLEMSGYGVISNDADRFKRFHSYCFGVHEHTLPMARESRLCGCVVSLVSPQPARAVSASSSAPWTRSRQEQIESDLRAAWKDDPIVLTNGLGVPQVLEKSHRTQ